MSNNEGKTVLNVNDDESARYAVTRMLLREGFEVIEAETGFEALEQAKKKPVVIILDLKLPDISGFEVCSHLKENPATSAIPVIMVSATFTGTEHQVEGLDRGADGYLTWPLEAPVIGATVRAIIRARHAEERLRKLNESLEDRISVRTRELVAYQNQLRSLAAELNRVELMERQRIAAELHDNLAQMLTACAMKLAVARIETYQPDMLDELKDMLGDALGYTRSLMSDLSPPAVLHQDELPVALYWLADQMRKKGLAVQIKDSGAPLRVNGDALTIIFQSVRELLTNIVKHAGTRRAVIDIDRDGQTLVVAVEDEGKGFDAALGLSGPTTDGGFGLFNIQERLGLMGGSLQIESAQGSGTRAVLRLPLTSAEPAPPEDHTELFRLPGTARVPRGDRERMISVLLVDDHVIVRQGLRSILETQPDVTVVAEAFDGRSALQLASELLPDVVVMDVSMPGMDGLEATRRLTAGLPYIRVVGLSLHQEKEIAEAMLEAGACAYLTKDEAFETLGTTIRNCVRVEEDEA